MAKKTKPNESFKSEFKSALISAESPPFLFAGSGLSIRYCGVPTWMALLKDFVENNSDCFEEEFGYYSSRCSNNPLEIASQLADEFHGYWWKTKKFKISRDEYEEISGLNTEIAFKIELSNFVRSKIDVSKDLSAEIELMSKAVVSGVLTTNWDDFLQGIFRDFQPQIGQKDTLFADHKSLGELYKIHGCISKPESLVVTSKDYKNFIEDNYYLNSKLLTLFADYPIIFMGYSLSDPNIGLILQNLIKCLDSKLLHSEKLANRLFFVEWQAEPCVPTIEASTYTVNSNSFSVPLMKVKVHDMNDVWEVLSEIPRTIPVRILRQLQNMVYDFVMTSKPTDKVFVNGLEGLDKIENLEVVVGFGNISKLMDRGIIGLKDIDLLKDLLFCDIPTDNYKDIVEKLLPSMIRKNVYMPFFKYQKAVKNLNRDNSLKDYFIENHTLERSKNISVADYQLVSQFTRKTKIAKGYGSLKELIDDLDFIHAIQTIPYLDLSKINVDVLREFLKDNWENIGLKSSYFSQYRKCICLLDYLENANH